jgi:predicted TIM-barrel fold metal-dependent hydrolase
MTKIDNDLQANIPIIDAHHHLWDLQGHINYAWLVHHEHNWLGNYSAIQRTYLAPEYLRDTALHNVIGTVAIEAECDRSQQVAETKWFSEVSEQYGLPSVIVAHAWVDTPNAEEILAQQVQYKRVRGIRTKPIIAATPTDSVKGQPRSLQDPKWIKGLALLEK